MADDQLQVTLARSRETKRMVRFEASDEGAAVPDVYMRKDAVSALGEPREVVVTVQAAAAPVTT